MRSEIQHRCARAQHSVASELHSAHEGIGASGPKSVKHWRLEIRVIVGPLGGPDDDLQRVRVNLSQGSAAMQDRS